MNAKELDEAIRALPTHNYHVAMSDFYAARLALVLKVVREYTETRKARDFAFDGDGGVEGDEYRNAELAVWDAEANLRTILQLEGV